VQLVARLWLQQHIRHITREEELPEDLEHRDVYTSRGFVSVTFLVSRSNSCASIQRTQTTNYHAKLIWQGFPSILCAQDCRLEIVNGWSLFLRSSVPQTNATGSSDNSSTSSGPSKCCIRSQRSIQPAVYAQLST
jgi:hypothetical protein